MYAATICIFGLVMAGLSFAQTSTVTLFVPGADAQPLVASIVGSDAAATTYALQCAPGTDSSDCGINGVVTLTEGPATAKFTIPAELDTNGTLAFTGYFDCSLAGTTSAVCVESFGGDEANFPGISTETLTGTELTYMPITITARATGSATVSPISAVPSTKTTGLAATNTSGASTMASGSITKAGSGGSSSGAAQSVSSKGAASTAGGSAVTGNKRWVLGGAVLALVLMG